MEIEEIAREILLIGASISGKMRAYIHYNSFRNFIDHFSEIKGSKEKSVIEMLLTAYIKQIRENNFEFDAYSSSDLAKRYLFKIAEFYRKDSNFFRIIKNQSALIYGVLIDSLLYFAGILSRVGNFPFVTLLFLSYCLFVRLFKMRQGRVYGMFY